MAINRLLIKSNTSLVSFRDILKTTQPNRKRELPPFPKREQKTKEKNCDRAYALITYQNDSLGFCRPSRQCARSSGGTLSPGSDGISDHSTENSWTWVLCAPDPQMSGIGYRPVRSFTAAVEGSGAASESAGFEFDQEERRGTYYGERARPIVPVQATRSRPR